jgi:hypothetical protein
VSGKDKTTTGNLTQCGFVQIMRWEVHVARTGDRRGAYRVLVGKKRKKKETNHLEDLSVDGSIILICISNHKFKKTTNALYFHKYGVMPLYQAIIRGSKIYIDLTSIILVQ